MGLETGTKLGQYEIVGVLGAGGMGEVYRARDARLRRDVAVKVLPAGVRFDQERLHRFEQEARAAGSLNHPGIISVFDVGEHDGSPYLITELLEGSTLRAKLDSGPLPVRRALDFATQIAKALAVAHDRGIVHRDLKPANLFVTKDGRIKILDFGIAKVVDATPEAPSTMTAGNTSEGSVLGTAGYMAPEQVRGNDVDPRADLFALGVVLYEMLTGKAPFAKSTAIDRAFATLNDEPPQIENIPRTLGLAVSRCLEKDRDRRFHSAHDLVFVLENSADAVPSKPRRKLALPIAVAVGVAAAGTSALVIGRSSSRQVRATPNVVFQRLSFRSGWIGRARFSPDEKSYAFGGWFDGDDAAKIYSLADGSVEPRVVTDHQAFLLDLSNGGELAMLTEDSGRLVLARAPFAGGAPRPIAESIGDAAWSPNHELAVARVTPELSTLEYPPGKSLRENRASRAGRWYIDLPAFSPDGAHIAYAVASSNFGPDELDVIDLGGRQSTLVPPGPWLSGIQWRNPHEVWFGTSSSHQLRAVTLGGTTRVLADLPGSFTLQDVARDGRVLLTRDDWNIKVLAHVAGENAERDVTWLNNSRVVDISSDGKQMLFAEADLHDTHDIETYFRPLDGLPAVHLSRGAPFALSNDGKWAVVAPNLPATALELVPTGTGEVRRLELGPIAEVTRAMFMPDGQRIAIEGNEVDKRGRIWLLDVSGGPPRPISAEGTNLFHAVSPAGTEVIGKAADSDAVIAVPVDGSTPRPLEKLEGEPIQWSADGRSLYVRQRSVIGPLVGPTKIVKFDLQTQVTTSFLEFPNVSPKYNQSVQEFCMTGDTATYVYSIRRMSSTLYLVTGLD